MTIVVPQRTMFGHFAEDIVLDFDVIGHAAPQGSKRHVGNGVMVEMSKYLKPWRALVEAAAREALAATDRPELFPLQVPTVLTATFFIDRPGTHFRTGPYKHMLRDNAPPYPARRPDLDKLLRSTMDAITTAGVWRDDGLVHIIHARKHWSTYRARWYAPGVRVVLSTPA